MTRTEKVTTAWMVASVVADMATTADAIDRGAREENPLMSEQPDPESLIFFGVVKVGVVVAVGYIWPKIRNALNIATAAEGTYLAIRNNQVER